MLISIFLCTLLVPVIVSLSAPALQAGDKPAASAEAALFPLRKGLKWTMNRKFLGSKDFVRAYEGLFPNEDISGGKAWIEEVVGIVVERDLVCYEIQGLFKGQSWGDHSWGSRKFWYAAKSDGVYLVSKMEGTVKFINDPPVCILKPHSDTAQKWECEYTNVSLGLGDPYKMKGKFFQYIETVKHDGKDVEATLVINSSRFPDGSGSDIKTWYLPGKGQIRKETLVDRTENRTEDVTTSFSGSNSVQIGKVVLNDARIEKEGRTDIIESDVGGETTYTKTRTIRREISYSVKIGLGAEVEAKLGGAILGVRGELTGRVKASISGELGEKWTDEITETATHKINLDKNPKVKVIWLDVYRTGTVEVVQDGKMFAVPFEFPIATRTVLKAFK